MEGNQCCESTTSGIVGGWVRGFEPMTHKCAQAKLPLQSTNQYNSCSYVHDIWSDFKGKTNGVT
jgi:hypothetical protein